MLPRLRSEVNWLALNGERSPFAFENGVFGFVGKWPELLHRMCFRGVIGRISLLLCSMGRAGPGNCLLLRETRQAIAPVFVAKSV